MYYCVWDVWIDDKESKGASNVEKCRSFTVYSAAAACLWLSLSVFIIGSEAINGDLLITLLILLLTLLTVITCTCSCSPATACTHTDALRWGCWCTHWWCLDRTLYVRACDLVSLVAMTIPAASPWLVNELGEPLCTVAAPPSYSYDPNGSDLPRGQRSPSFTKQSSLQIWLLMLLFACVQTVEFSSITSI